MSSTSSIPSSSPTDLELLNTAALLLRLSPEDKERLIEQTNALAADESGAAHAAMTLAACPVSEDVSPVDSKGSATTAASSSTYEAGATGVPQHERLDDALKAFSDAYIAALLSNEEAVSDLSMLLPQGEHANQHHQHLSGCDTDRPAQRVSGLRLLELAKTPPPPPRLPGDARLFGRTDFVRGTNTGVMEGSRTPAPGYPSFLLEEQWSPKKKMSMGRSSFPSSVTTAIGGNPTTSSSIIQQQQQAADTGRSSVKSTGMSFQKIQCFKTKQCRFWLDGRCTRGDDCTFAHCDGELRDKPDLTKTKICAKWRAGQCDKPAALCTYAHGVEELRQIPADAESNSREDCASRQENGAWWAPGNEGLQQQGQHW